MPDDLRVIEDLKPDSQQVLPCQRRPKEWKQSVYAACRRRKAIYLEDS